MQSNNWQHIRDQFSLDYTKIHLALNMVAPTPHIVQQEIKLHQQGFEKNPTLYYRHKDHYAKKNLHSLANYLIADENNIAITNSTTEGLAIILNGLTINAGQQIISTTHDHYALDQSVTNLSKQKGLQHTQITLYHSPLIANKNEIINNLRNAIGNNTRIICLTWVHSCSGITIPLQEIGHLIAEINNTRAENEKIITVVDAVHAIGFEGFNSIADLCCDFIISGIHKWLFGPRGTGFIWGSNYGWSQFTYPIIVSFDNSAFYTWRYAAHANDTIPKGRLASPGGFPTFEYRWAIHRAIDFMHAMGKQNIKARIIQHSEKLYQFIAAQKHIVCYSPTIASLRSGLICFDIKGVAPSDVVDRLIERGMIIGQTPYKKSCVRIATSILNSEEDIHNAINIMQEYLQCITKRSYV